MSEPFIPGSALNTPLPRYDLAALNAHELEIQRERAMHIRKKLEAETTLREADINLVRCDGALALIDVQRTSHDWSPLETLEKVSILSD